MIDITVADMEGAAGKILNSTDKSTLLMSRWRYPSLSIHGIEGAFSGVGAKTVIPANVMGKFSIRLVPNLTPEATDKLVQTYLLVRLPLNIPEPIGELIAMMAQSEYAKLNSKNTLKVEMLSGGTPWLADINHWNFVAAANATKSVYGQTPDYTREGGSIPITLTFAESLGKNVLLLPMGRCDDGAHSTNEKLDKSNYLLGTRLLGEYLHEVAKAV